jgi:hypothetical protein
MRSPTKRIRKEVDLYHQLISSRLCYLRQTKFWEIPLSLPSPPINSVKNLCSFRNCNSLFILFFTYSLSNWHGTMPLRAASVCAKTKGRVSQVLYYRQFDKKSNITNLYTPSLLISSHIGTKKNHEPTFFHNHHAKDISSFEK